MTTPFDYLTIACFCGLVATFFLWTDRHTRSLMHLIISGIAFAIANQVGNAGLTLFAFVLIVAGIGYALLVVRGKF
jgi:hypothetical protein